MIWNRNTSYRKFQGHLVNSLKLDSWTWTATVGDKVGDNEFCNRIESNLDFWALWDLMKSTRRVLSVQLLLLLKAISQHWYYEQIGRWQMLFSEGKGKIMCLVARREANDYVLNETAIQHTAKEKTFGSHCGKNMETISPVQNSRKGKSKRGCVAPARCSGWVPWVLLVLWINSHWPQKQGSHSAGQGVLIPKRRVPAPRHSG